MIRFTLVVGLAVLPIFSHAASVQSVPNDSAGNQATAAQMCQWFAKAVDQNTGKLSFERIDRNPNWSFKVESDDCKQAKPVVNAMFNLSYSQTSKYCGITDEDLRGVTLRVDDQSDRNHFTYYSYYQTVSPPCKLDKMYASFWFDQFPIQKTEVSDSTFKISVGGFVDGKPANAVFTFFRGGVPGNESFESYSYDVTISGQRVGQYSVFTN